MFRHQVINTSMKKYDEFFDGVDYVSIISTIKGIYTSDGSMSVLLDFERCLEEADIYAYENWELGELVQGPSLNNPYTVSCIFMWPQHLMPNPKACLRLLPLGCNITWKKTKIKIPVQPENYDDFIPGTMMPRMMPYKVWLVRIEMPRELMNEIREGSIDLAGQTIDLSDLDDSYLQDLDKEEAEGGDTKDQGMGDQAGLGGPPGLGGPALGPGMAPPGGPGAPLPPL